MSKMSIDSHISNPLSTALIASATENAFCHWSFLLNKDSFHSSSEQRHSNQLKPISGSFIYLSRMPHPNVFFHQTTQISYNLPFRLSISKCHKVRWKRDRKLRAQKITLIMSWITRAPTTRKTNRKCEIKNCAEIIFWLCR